MLGPPPPRPAPPNKLTEAERQHILTVLRSEEYCDLAPAQVWARLLDDGVYLCSISTMYRLASPARAENGAGSAATRPANGVDQRTQPRSTHPIRIGSCLIPP